MKLFILITGILELTVGLAMLVNPKFIPSYKKAGGALITTARMYGGAAFSIAIFALLVVSDFENKNFTQSCFFIFFFFHTTVALAVLISFISKQTREINIGFIHSLFAVITLYFLITF
jgi:uncharacterized membrane protein YwaF